MASNSWWRRLFRRDGAPALDPMRADLVEVASSFDDTEACSRALGRATEWVAEQPVVLRHVLRLPAAQVEAVRAIVAQEGYTVQAVGDGEPLDLIVQRVQILDALHCAQERSRMAGLAQRHEGDALGWRALQPPH
ncbi:hypothetical protein HLB23_20410 [Nocardia uniformis]|uniref:Uncharacterized protein n=1 Tax=Nocardia uniformis TaxID=53432 RepID=A0A849CFK6_9NOCA|nr:hypothetical protein [Nocardia uniformis]NNH72191.1 hypothetical protein [Nocardia uniformis]